MPNDQLPIGHHAADLTSAIDHDNRLSWTLQHHPRDVAQASVFADTDDRAHNVFDPRRLVRLAMSSVATPRVSELLDQRSINN